MRVVDVIDLLCDTPAAGSALKGEFEGLRRLRVGLYRVVYEWQRSELVILVVRIGHRREVYRRRETPETPPTHLQLCRSL